ncbi:MAG TPA: carboxymuconolactone decarboxylase family protein [Dermatophilaceae bacterium]|jgi:alkylhydroperoxidase/carboxymuconolactone decarboxylase family protein YurZ
MTDYLPDIYVSFRERFPQVAQAQDRLAAEIDAAGPLDERTSRLVKLGIAVGSLSEGAVRSNVRKAMAAGATVEEVQHVVLLSLTTRGFPAAVAAWGWVQEVLDQD